MIDVPARSQSPRGTAGPDRIRPVLKRPGDERGGQPGLAGGRQVAVVRRGQHHLAGLEPEHRGRYWYACGSGLYARDRSEPRMRSQSSPAAFAMSSSSDVFPFDSGPTM